MSPNFSALCYSFWNKVFSTDDRNGYLCATGGVSAATAIFWEMGGRVDPWQVSLLYLPLVIACAVWFGFGPAIFGAVLSFCCWDYFLLSPFYKFSLDSPRDWISLIVFLVAAVTTAHLGSNARFKAAEADTRTNEVTTLFTASQVIALEVDTDDLLNTLVNELLRVCSAPYCALLSSTFADRCLTVVAKSSVGRLPLEFNDLVEAGTQLAVEDTSSQTIDISGLALGNATQHLVVRFLKGPGLSSGLYVLLQIGENLVGAMHVGSKFDGSEYSQQELMLIVTLSRHAAVVLAREKVVQLSMRQAEQVAVLAERNRFAKDVHDTLSHSFVGIRFMLEAAAVSTDDQLAEYISKARSLAIDGAQEARRSVWALRPAALHCGDDLPTALRRTIDQRTGAAGPRTTFSVSGEPKLLQDGVEDNLLRICQELMTNVLRHASASDVNVSLVYSAEEVSVSINDNGKGFNPLTNANNRGFGFKSIRERCESFGGSLAINTREGEGTEVTARVPLASGNQKLWC